LAGVWTASTDSAPSRHIANATTHIVRRRSFIPSEGEAPLQKRRKKVSKIPDLANVSCGKFLLSHYQPLI
jgi:hypothetical protein